MDVTLAAVSGGSRRGRGHDRNEDRWAVASGNGMVLAAVADGMGSTVGGGAAASIALRAVFDVLTCPAEPARAARAAEPAGPARAARPAGTAEPAGAVGEDATTGAAAADLAAGDLAAKGLAAGLAAAVARAQQRVRAAAPAGAPEAVRAGTTLTAALIAGDRLHLAHVGDSSCWLYRRGLLRRLTEVHTTAAVLIAAGVIDHGSAAARRLGNLLTRYLGMPGPLEPQLCTVRLHAGDRLLLASDGLTGALPPHALALLLAGPQATAADLAADAVAHGCTDDVTAVLAAVAADYAVSAETAGAAEQSAAPAQAAEVRPSRATGGLPAASQSGGGSWRRGGDGR